jgi:hypothetical protein
MDKTRIIDKVYKCLRLSESCNANEAAAALRQAQRLMEKYGISEGQVLAARIGESSVSAPGAVISFWAVALAELVGDAFACRAYVVRRNRTASEFRFIGAGHSPQVSAYTFSILRRRLEQGRARFVEELAQANDEQRERQGDAFTQAWLFRISRTVERFVADPATETAMDEYTQQHYGDVGEWHRGSPSAGEGDYDAYLRGLHDAARVRLFRPCTRDHDGHIRLEAYA